MNKYATELIGTFFLVLTIGCTVIPGVAMAPLAIGAILMVMVFAGGHISGAHYNPAVTVAVTLRGRCDAKDFLPYIIAQIVGAILAALVVTYLYGSAVPMPIKSIPRALLSELLYTFALAYVVLNVATAKGTMGNSFYGLGIGMTVMAAAYSVGGLSGGAFNPAVAIGLAAMRILQAGDIWIHIIADLAGGALAAITFKALNPTDA